MRLLRPTGVSRLCMKACAGPGKSAVLAWAGWWFLSCFGEVGEHPKGAAVSITGDNLKDNLWPEFRKWQAFSPYLSQAFTWQGERIFANDHPDTWFLSARSFPKTANPEEQGRTLSGLHSKYPFIILDESGDMAPALGRAAEQAMGNCKSGLIAQAGNTTSLDGLLYDSANRDAKNWDVISISADPDDPERTPRVGIEWARAQIAKYGRDNPWVMAYVLGKFPPSSLNALLGHDEVELAMGRHLREEQYSFAAKVIGVDCARFGDDRTVQFPRQGLAAFQPVIMRNAKTYEIAARVAAGVNKWNADAVFVDDTGGYGAGVIDALEQGGIDAIPVQFAGKPNDPRYLNKRAEIWFLMAEWVRKGGALPHIPELIREMTSPLYSFKGGKFALEEKDQIKKRLGFSPDLADALAMTLAQEVVPRSGPGATRFQAPGRPGVAGWPQALMLGGL